MIPKPKAVLIISGGLDSTVLAYWLHDQGYSLHLMSFDYGQRHVKELEYAKITAKKLLVAHDIIDLRQLTGLLTTSSLTNPDIAVPDGWYTDETMKITVVPNRNMIMLSIAAGVAVAENASGIATAVHSGDHFIYPDCRPAFIVAAERAIRIGNEGFANEALHIIAPFVNSTKADIVRTGNHLQVPFTDSWSCYKGGDIHCGKCGTCNERKEAFQLAGVADPTEYEYRGAYVHNH